MQFSGVFIYTKWYPLLFTSRGCNSNTFAAQAVTQRSQPLQRLMFTVTVPFIFAILLQFEAVYIILDFFWVAKLDKNGKWALFVTGQTRVNALKLE
ncbi:hypothetical protein Barb4_00996 [Bacteroidales bacterium Barb4]|nr:hypothetical protein Barb4_00996 [Bacteroidales bacterium Barb4]